MQNDEVHEITLGRSHYKPMLRQKVLEYLNSHKYITSLDARKEFGCMRLSTVIKELEEQGNIIIRHTLPNGIVPGEIAYSILEGGKVGTDHNQSNSIAG